jgi:hypothetical protein
MSDFSSGNPMMGQQGESAGGPPGRRHAHIGVTLRKGQKHYQKPSLEKAIKYKVRRADGDGFSAYPFPHFQNPRSAGALSHLRRAWASARARTAGTSVVPTQEG